MIGTVSGTNAIPVGHIDNLAAWTNSPNISGTYTVVAGDTLFNIAETHRITLQQLQDANPGIVATNLLVGEAIALPPPASTNGTPSGMDASPVCLQLRQSVQLQHFQHLLHLQRLLEPARPVRASKRNVLGVLWWYPSRIKGSVRTRAHSIHFRLHFQSPATCTRFTELLNSL